MADQTLSVKIEADASGLVKETAAAASALEDLQSDVADVGAESVDVAVNIDADAAQKQLGDVAATAERLDAETIEIPALLEMDRINRDRANLERILDGLERRKATADIGMDLTQLLKDEGKARAAIDALDAREVEVSARIDVDTTGINAFRAALDDLDTNISGLPPGLSKLTEKLGAKGVAGAAASAGAAFGMWQLGTMAADVETMTVQLDALTGEGEAAVAMLQEFAAGTPFQMDELTRATIQLSGAGIELEDMPATLTSLGNAAAALSPENFEAIAGAFAQMAAKGEISNEELDQLREAGVPAARLLAEEMGITQKALEDMATAGKLGADDLQVLLDVFDQEFGGAMARQAETFNGQMSTLSDNLSQLGAALGELVLPHMTDLVGLLNSGLGPLVGWAQALADFSEKVEDVTSSSLFQWAVMIGAPGTGVLWSAAEAANEVANELTNVVAHGERLTGLDSILISTSGLLGDTADEAETAAIGAELFGDALDDSVPGLQTLNDELATLLDSYSTLKPDALSVEEAVVAQADAFKALRDTAKEGGTSLNEFGAAGARNRLAIADLITAQDELRTASIKEGDSRKEANKIYRQSLGDLEDFLVAQGFNADAVDRVVASMSKVDKRKDVELSVLVKDDELIRMTHRLRDLKNDKIEIETSVTGGGAADPLSRFLTEGGESPTLDAVTAPIDTKIRDLKGRMEELNSLEGTALINAVIPPNQRAAAEDALDKIANPQGRGREAAIIVEPKGVETATTAIDDVAVDRTARIFVEVVGGGVTPQSIITGNTGTNTGTGPPPPGGRTTTDLAPKSAPVRVYLDGDEISEKTYVRAAARFNPAGRGNRRP